MEQRITVDSILDKKFSTVAKGFNQQEVDEYLDQICDEFDRRDAEMNALRQEIAQLKAAQANGSNTVPQQTRMEAATDDSFREILEMAKKDARTHLVVSVITAGNEASVSLHGRFGFTYCGTIHEVGEKFGRLLDIENYELEV